MGRSGEFEGGKKGPLFPHATLEEYLDFAERRPTHATARELVHNAIPADLGMVEEHGRMFRMDGPDSPEAVMDRKYESAQKRGIAEDVLKRGIVNPIRMVPDGATAPLHAYRSSAIPGMPHVPLLWNGQHRVAVMYKHAPDEPIPLDWDSFEGFEGRRGNVAYNKPIPPTPKPEGNRGQQFVEVKQAPMNTNNRKNAKP